MKMCSIVFLILLVILAIDTEGAQTKQNLNATVKGKEVPRKTNISPIKYWTSKGKSKDQIAEAYYCAKNNLWKDGLRQQKNGTNKGTRDLFKVLY